jgi:hypothetical protein
MWSGATPSTASKPFMICHTTLQHISERSYFNQIELEHFKHAGPDFDLCFTLIQAYHQYSMGSLVYDSL